MRVLLNNNPLHPSSAPPDDLEKASRARPAWIAPHTDLHPPEVIAYKLHFELPRAALVRIHVSADERYKFFADGQLIGRGPERGSDRAWFYETYDVELSVGEHTFVAIVWQLGDIGPEAQIGLATGFMLGRYLSRHFVYKVSCLGDQAGKRGCFQFTKIFIRESSLVCGTNTDY